MKTWMQLFKRYYRWLACLPAIAAILICIMIGTHIESSNVRCYNFDIIALDTEWYAADGTECALGDLPYGNVTLEHSVADINLQNKRLCLKSVDTFFEVYADGALIYSYFPQQSPLLGASYGMYIHTIPLPPGTRTITVNLIPVYPNAPPALLDTVIEDAGMFIVDIFKEGIPGFSICTLMVVLGCIMILLGIFSDQQSRNHQIEFFTLGIFALFVGAWSVNDTLVLQTITQMPAIVRLMNYLTLIFLPYFAVAFIAYATNNQDSMVMRILYGMVWINFVLNVGLTTAGISDYFDLVKISQAVIVVAVGMAVYLVIYAVRRKKAEKRFLRTLLLGVCALALGAAIDLVRFRATITVKQMTSSFSRIGTLMFLLIIGIYLILENNRNLKETGRELTRLAFSDGLTGLKNRSAFHEAEATLRSNPEAECMIIQFDVNNLKNVNDVYGHAEGDRHLYNAARVIRESVGEAGDCFRTGGDEFIAILRSAHSDAATSQQIIRQMEQLIAEYNEREQPPVPLEVAYGMALFRAADGKLELAEQLADKRMYQCKLLQKSKPLNIPK